LCIVGRVMGGSRLIPVPLLPAQSSIHPEVSPGAYVRKLEKGRRSLPSSPRGWHNQLMNALWLSLLFGAPWLAAIAYTWSRAPRMDGPPPSMADRTRERLWA
jgi:hypothetical protein